MTNTLYEMFEENGYHLDFKNAKFQGNTIYVAQPVYNLSRRKLESLIWIAEVQKYYQANPVKFVSDFFNVELIDFQKWIFQMAWVCPNVLILASRAAGKSFIINLLVMSRSMLFNNYWTFIASNTGEQAKRTFRVIEKLAKNQIDELKNSTGEIFLDEVIKPKADSDGFTHNPAGYEYQLYNGSKTKTLNSGVDANRGERGSVILDEIAFMAADAIQSYNPFAASNKEFATGKDEFGNALTITRIASMPKALPYQRFYISSAGSTDTEFYRMYRHYSKKMLAGDRRYFVANLDCNVIFHPTMNGKPLSPLITPAVVEDAMKTNPEKARREYYCQFTTDAGDNAIVRRSTVLTNSEVRVPLLYNDTGDKKFVIVWDPARRFDNSVIMVAEIYIDKQKRTRGRVVNCISMVDKKTKNKIPKTAQEQIAVLRQTILDYNRGGDSNYSNILKIYIDAGSGGVGSHADYLAQSWVDEDGIEHKGLADFAYMGDQMVNYSKAVDKVLFAQPNQYKSAFYESLIQVMDQHDLTLTANYDNKGYITITDLSEQQEEFFRNKYKDELSEDFTDEVQLNKEVERKLIDLRASKAHMYQLTQEEEAALINIDIAKEEVTNMMRIKRDSGKDGFELIPEKRNIMHDDHSYTLAMIGYALQQEQRMRAPKQRKKASRSIADLASLTKKSKPRTWNQRR